MATAQIKTMSNKARETHLRQVTQIKPNERLRTSSSTPVKQLMVPLNFAINHAFITRGNEVFRYFERMAQENGTSVLEAHNTFMRTSTTDIVKTVKLIGANGVGKTASVINQAINWVKRMGMNPRVFNIVDLDKNGMMYPNGDKDVLIMHINLAGKERADLTGLPVANKNQTELIVNDNFIIEMDEKGQPLFNIVTGQEQTRVPMFASLKQFAYGIVLFDEPNRSAEHHIFNGIMNGERGIIDFAKYGTMIIATQNSEFDNMNFNLTAQDAANITKTDTYFVYQTVEDWSEWIADNGVRIHASVLAFARTNANLRQSLESPEVHPDGEGMPFPTFRGLMGLSDNLLALEEFYGSNDLVLSEMVVALTAQATIGRHAIYANLPEEFAEFYILAHRNIIPEIKKTLFTPALQRMYVGFANKKMTAAMYHTTDGDDSQYDSDLAYENSFMKNISADHMELFKRALPYYIANEFRQLMLNPTINIQNLTASHLMVLQLKQPEYAESILARLKQSNAPESAIQLFNELVNGGINYFLTDTFMVTKEPDLMVIANADFMARSDKHVQLTQRWVEYWRKGLSMLFVASGGKSSIKTYRMYKNMLVDLMSESIRNKQNMEMYGVISLYLSNQLQKDEYSDYNYVKEKHIADMTIEQIKLFWKKLEQACDRHIISNGEIFLYGDVIKSVNQATEELTYARALNVTNAPVSCHTVMPDGSKLKLTEKEYAQYLTFLRFNADVINEAELLEHHMPSNIAKNLLDKTNNLFAALTGNQH